MISRAGFDPHYGRRPLQQCGISQVLGDEPPHCPPQSFRRPVEVALLQDPSDIVPVVV